MSNLGTAEGEVCGRDGCAGVIELTPVDDCACHISPPCFQHENQTFCCPVCEWVDESKA